MISVFSQRINWYEDTLVIIIYMYRNIVVTMTCKPYRIKWEGVYHSPFIGNHCKLKGLNLKTL